MSATCPHGRLGCSACMSDLRVVLQARIAELEAEVARKDEALRRLFAEAHPLAKSHAGMSAAWDFAKSALTPSSTWLADREAEVARLKVLHREANDRANKHADLAAAAEAEVARKDEALRTIASPDAGFSPTRGIETRTAHWIGIVALNRDLAERALTPYSTWFAEREAAAERRGLERAAQFVQDEWEQEIRVAGLPDAIRALGPGGGK